MPAFGMSPMDTPDDGVIEAAVEEIQFAFMFSIPMVCTL
tara:strand:+ start:563 stop:679 length:117 start_codon:yes stop_codon:yes gene_type:complete